MRIAIYGDMFVEWGGGIDFLRIILKGLNAMPQIHASKIYLIIPNKEISLTTYLKYSIKKIINFISGKEVYIAKLSKPLEIQQIKDNFNKDPSIEIVFVKHSKKSLEKRLLELKIEVILPSFFSLGREFGIPWVGYLYDFQHQHLPHLFSIAEVKKRDEQFLEMLNEAVAVLVNSRSVKNDAVAFSAIDSEKVYALPFCPLYSNERINVSSKISNLPSKYFLISNQFWKHKDHITAFKALKHFFELGGSKDIHLLCTGEIQDYRFPGYKDEILQLIAKLDIKNNVHLLGFIPKDKQLYLLQESIAVIQPTLCEGGPGGGAAYEALARNKYLVISDIPVNKEIVDDRCLFFKAGNYIDLTNNLFKAIELPALSETINLDIEINQTKELGIMLEKAIRYAILKSNRQELK